MDRSTALVPAAEGEVDQKLYVRHSGNPALFAVITALDT
jgi:hypothetical protein